MAAVLIIGFCLQANGEEFIAGYHVDGGYLILGSSISDEDKQLKPFNEMTPEEVATIYHEMWHAHFLLNEKSGKTDLYKRLESRANHLFRDAPKDRRLEILEEAIGDFIDAVVGTYVQMKRFLASKTPDRRKEIARSSRYFRSYSRIFDEAFTGYYTRRLIQADPGNCNTTSDEITSPTLAGCDSGLDDQQTDTIDIYSPEEVFARFIGEAERFSLPTRYLREATDALNGVAYLEGPAGSVQADVVFGTGSLEREDLAYLIPELFEDRLTTNPLEVFAEDRFERSKSD